MENVATGEAAPPQESSDSVIGAEKRIELVRKNVAARKQRKTRSREYSGVSSPGTPLDSSPSATTITNNNSDILFVWVMCFDGRKARICMDPYDTVDELQKVVAEDRVLGCVPVHKQRLFLNGRALAGGHRLKDVPGMRGSSHKNKNTSNSNTTAKVRLKVCMLSSGSGSSSSSKGDANNNKPSPPPPSLSLKHEGDEAKLVELDSLVARQKEKKTQLELEAAAKEGAFNDLVCEDRQRRRQKASLGQQDFGKSPLDRSSLELAGNALEEARKGRKQQENKCEEGKQEKQGFERVAGVVASGSAKKKKAAEEGERKKVAEAEAALIALSTALEQQQRECADAGLKEEVKEGKVDESAAELDRARKKLEKRKVALQRAQSEREETLTKWQSQRQAMEGERKQRLKSQRVERAAFRVKLAELKSADNDPKMTTTPLPSPTSVLEQEQQQEKQKKQEQKQKQQTKKQQQQQQEQLKDKTQKKKQQQTEDTARVMEWERARLSLLEQRESKLQEWMEEEREWQAEMTKLGARVVGKQAGIDDDKDEEDAWKSAKKKQQQQQQQQQQHQLQDIGDGVCGELPTKKLKRLPSLKESLKERRLSDKEFHEEQKELQLTMAMANSSSSSSSKNNTRRVSSKNNVSSSSSVSTSSSGKKNGGAVSVALPTTNDHPQRTLLLQRTAELEMRAGEDARRRSVIEVQVKEQLLKQGVQHAKASEDSNKFFEEKKAQIQADLNELEEKQEQEKLRCAEVKLAAMQRLGEEKVKLGALQVKVEVEEGKKRIAERLLEAILHKSKKELKGEVKQLTEKEAWMATCLGKAKVVEEAAAVALAQCQERQRRQEVQVEALLVQAREEMEEAQERVKQAVEGVSAAEAARDSFIKEAMATTTPTTATTTTTVTTAATGSAAAAAPASSLAPLALAPPSPPPSVLRFDLTWGWPYDMPQGDGAVLLYSGTTLVSKAYFKKPLAASNLGVVHGGDSVNDYANKTGRNQVEVELKLLDEGKVDSFFVTLSEGDKAGNLGLYRKPTVTLTDTSPGSSYPETMLDSYSFREGEESSSVIMCQAVKTSSSKEKGDGYAEEGGHGDGSGGGGPSSSSSSSGSSSGWSVFEVGLPSKGRADRKGFVELDKTCLGIILDLCDDVDVDQDLDYDAGVDCTEASHGRPPPVSM